MGGYITDGAAKKLGDECICSRCGATLASYADLCSAALDERCPGFERIEQVVAETKERK